MRAPSDWDGSVGATRGLRRSVAQTTNSATVTRGTEPSRSVAAAIASNHPAGMELRSRHLRTFFAGSPSATAKGMTPHLWMIWIKAMLRT